jgi:UPF0755 protein
MKRLSPLKVSLFFLSAFALLFVSYLGWSLFVPPRADSSVKVVRIKKGMNLRQIAGLLQDRGVIRNKHLFILITTLLGKKAHIRAGEYEFNDIELPLEVLDTLVKGQVKRHLITIPEGYTLAQIAQLLDDQEITKGEGFLQKASSPDFIASLGLFPLLKDREPVLEGFLFPETYHLYKEMDPEEVIRMMVSQFKKVAGPDMADKASRLGISDREAVILASIIEKETSFPEEKPLVSAVFHNRLSRKMPLQSDPTVIYGIANFNGNLTREDLQRPTPYNTYLRTGLPPTPICNPGKESLLAALKPAAVPYLYFVSKNDGSHYFSSEIEDHNHAVWKYQKQGRKNNLTKK